MKTIEDVERYLVERRSLGIKPGLERMNHLLAELNHPEQNLTVVHIAGTNGKGSTVQMVANLLKSHGVRVGVFSSPSFTGVTGHFTIDGQPIKEITLVQLMNQLVKHIEAMDKLNEAPTEFEIITALALLYFKERVDIAIIETGMGGRFDTTNCVSPALSVITTVSHDHEQFLGEKLEQIAYHKAGIIKTEVPVIIGPVNETALQVIEKEAKEKRAPIYTFGRDFIIDANSANNDRVRASSNEEKMNHFNWHWRNESSLSVALNLKGKHQRENAAIALAVFYQLKDMLRFSIDWQLVQYQLRKLKLPGRFEKVYENPVMIADSAHNIAGIEAFINTTGETGRKNSNLILFASFRDKRFPEMIEALKKSGFSITLTTFPHERAADVSDFRPLLKDASVSFEADWKGLIRQFIKESKKGDILYITGSLHFIMLIRNFVQHTLEDQGNFSRA